MQEGTKAKCLRGSIDRNKGSGEVGVVQGFARFSSYHALEAWVSFENWGAWFWVSDLEEAA